MFDLGNNLTKKKLYDIITSQANLIQGHKFCIGLLKNNYRCYFFQNAKKEPVFRESAM